MAVLGGAEVLVSTVEDTVAEVASVVCFANILSQPRTSCRVLFSKSNNSSVEV